MSVWQLLKEYVRDFEIANDVKFSNDAWQRIKKLEADIMTLQYASEKELRELYQSNQSERNGGNSA